MTYNKLIKMNNEKITNEFSYPKLLSIKRQVEYHLNNFQDNNVNKRFLIFEIIHKTLNIYELEEIFDIIKLKHIKIYNEIPLIFNDFVESTPAYKEIWHGEIGINKGLTEQLHSALISYSTGDFISFLIGQKVKIKKIIEKHPFLKFIFPEINLQIDSLIKKYSQLLYSEIESQTFLPIQNGLHCFFIYEKHEALNIFKKIYHNNLKYRKFPLSDYEFLTNVDLFFSRLNLNYIPNVYDINNGINSNSENSFIIKSEILNIVDNKDIFNKKYPLEDLDDKYFLIPSNIKNLEKIIATLNLFFKNELKVKKTEKIDFGSLFMDTLLNQYSKYDLQDLQDVRDELCEKLGNLNERSMFFALFYGMISLKWFVEVSEKLPKLLENYFSQKSFTINNIKTNLYRIEDISSNILKIRNKTNKEYLSND